MPVHSFDSMPDDARLWVFGAGAPRTGAAADTLLALVDKHLGHWTAHGAPIVCARDWRDDRFLAIAADERATNASGCSIDSLYHALEQGERAMGTSLVTQGAVYWRDAAGAVQASDRPTFRAAAARGDVSAETPVFDTTVVTVGEWRRTFEKKARESWHARLMR
jgi:hypothetical protein